MSGEEPTPVVVTELEADERDALLRHIADEHVFYEVRGIVRFFTLPQFARLDVPLVPRELAVELVDWMGSSTLEAGLVHVRCVVEFLTAAIPKVGSNTETDVVAAHYLSGKVIGDRYRDCVLGATREHQRKLLEQIHRRVMHLTTQRQTVEKDGPFVWRDYIVAHLQTVLTAFRGFLDELDKDPLGRSTWFQRTDELLTAVGLPKS